MLGGKIHNIETIKGKNEQNMAVFMIDLDESQATTTTIDGVQTTIFHFDLPILVHATVLSPQKDADSIDVSIPKNAKLYVNFLKPQVSSSLRGRYNTDCLFEHENFVGIGMIDDNVHRRIVEHRHTLNFKLYRICAALTVAFLVFGLIIFIKILFMADSGHSDTQHRDHEHPHTHDGQEHHAQDGGEKIKTE